MNFLKGTGVAIITPFKKSGEIDFNAYQLLIDFSEYHLRAICTPLGIEKLEQYKKEFNA